LRREDHVHKYLRPAHRPIAWVAFAVLLGLSSLALVRCTQVGERLTGVALERSNGRRDCIKACNERFGDLYEDERDRHLARVRACQGLPSGREKSQCLSAEARRHEDAKRELAREKRQCHDGCHRQGGGDID